MSPSIARNDVFKPFQEREDVRHNAFRVLDLLFKVAVNHVLNRRIVSVEERFTQFEQCPSTCPVLLQRRLVALRLLSRDIAL